MEAKELEELLKRRRSQAQLLIETSDLSRELADAAGRRDQVSIQMLLHMRETPIRQLQEIEEGIREYLLSLPEESAIRGHELLHGAEARGDEEIPLQNEAGRFLRLLASVQELDKRVSMAMGGKRSFYTTFRNS